MNPKCTVIHCNDGVGPTGTFIALSQLIDKIHSNAQKLNVFQTVLDLRKERKYMVRLPSTYNDNTSLIDSNYLLIFFYFMFCLSIFFL